MELKCTKMEGCGNDFIVVDYEEAKGLNLSKLTIELCDRHFGVGADGAIFVKQNPLEFIYYNSDGSFSSFCGNGMRCFAKYVIVLLKRMNLMSSVKIGLCIVKFVVMK